MTPFLNASRCPNCAAALPVQPVRCPNCRVALTGPIVPELVTTLRHADSLVDRMRANVAGAAAPQLHMPFNQPSVVARHRVPVSQPPPAAQGQERPEVVVARSWFAGKSVGVIC